MAGTAKCFSTPASGVLVRDGTGSYVTSRFRSRDLGNRFQLLTLLLLILGQAVLQAFEYRIEGNIQHFGSRGGPPTLSRDFELKVSNEMWYLRVEVPDVKGVSYAEVVYDGQSLYSYQSIDSSVAGGNRGVAVLEARSVPIRDGTLANYIWAGLASARYLSGLTNDQLQPLWSIGPARRQCVKGKWELLETPPFLPKRILYYSPAGQMPPPFDEEWVAGDLQTHSTTNVEGLMLPAEFSYVEFKPKRHATRREDLEKAYEVRVAVRSVQVGGAIRVEPPKALGTTLVEEWRLVTPPGAGPIVYASTNQRLPSAPEPSAVQIQRSYKAIALSQTKEAKPAKRLLILVLFLLSSASMLAVLLRSFGKLGPNTNKTAK